MQDLHGQLRNFRATHSYNYLDVAGICWRYIACGHGQEALLLLPGAPGLGEMAFQQITLLERTYRVLSVTYPSAAMTVAQIVDGLQTILIAESIQRIHIIGSSYGGLIAQCLVRHIPHKVEKLILSHTGVASTQVVRRYKLYSKLLFFLPLMCIHVLLKLGKYFFLSEVITQRAFWNDYFNEAIVSLSKEDYLSRMQVWIDCHQNYAFTCDEELQQVGKVLIIEAENDVIFLMEEREALKAMYPHARIHSFPQATHSAGITCLDEWLYVVTSFLAEKITIQEVYQHV